jgi:hypothetical protein
MHTDDAMDVIIDKARVLGGKKRPQMKISGAMEGAEIIP